MAAFAPMHAQSPVLDSLQQVLGDAQSPAERIAGNIALYWRMQVEHLDGKEERLYAAKGELSEEVGDSLHGEVLRILTEFHLRTHAYDSAHYYGNAALAKQGITPTQRVTVLSMVGTIHYYTADYEDAIGVHMQALSVCNEHDLAQQKARVFNNLGIANIKLENWDKAEEYMSSALELSREFNIQRGVLYCLGNLGIIYKNQDRIPDAIDVYRSSIALNRDMDDRTALARNLSNLAALFESEGELDSALVNYGKGLDIGQELNEDQLISSGYLNVASVLAKRGEYGKADGLYHNGLELAQKNGNRDLQMNAYSGLADLSERQGLWKNALKYERAEQSLRDSILNIENLATINELEIKYDTEKKENEILSLSQQKLLDQAELEKRDARITRLTYGLAGAMLLFGAIFIIYRQYTSNQRKRTQIDTIAETQVAERKRIAQDLHDGIGGSLATITSRITNLVATNPEHASELNTLAIQLSTTAKELRQISHNIMPGELVRFGLDPAVRTTLEQLNESGLETHLYSYGMEERIDETKEIHVYRIIQEAIQNVLKHAQATTLNIHLNRHPRSLDVLVEDDGKGFAADTHPGLGLKTIANRVASINGKYRLEPVPGRGTTLNVTVPL